MIVGALLSIIGLLLIASHSFQCFYDTCSSFSLSNTTIFLVATLATVVDTIIVFISVVRIPKKATYIIPVVIFAIMGFLVATFALQIHLGYLQ